MHRFANAVQTRKDGKLDEALPLFLKIIETQEEKSKASGNGVTPAPYEEAAKIYRKTKDREGEIALLERFAQQKHAPGAAPKKLLQRLVRAYELDGQIESKEEGGEKVQIHVGENVPVDQAPAFLGTASILDVETTGLSKQDDIMELGITRFRYSKLSGKVIDVLEGYQSFHEPCCDINPMAKKVHGLSLEDVKDHCIDKKHVQEILDGSDILIAHNASFDRRFLAKYFPEVNDASWYCSMSGVPWKSFGFSSKKLQDIVSEMGIDLDGKAHRALDDTKAVLAILERTDETGDTYFSSLIKGCPVGPPSARAERSPSRGAGNLTYTIKISDDKDDDPPSHAGGQGSGCFGIVATFVLGVAALFFVLA